MADALELGRSTTHRYATTLVTLGYLEQGPSRKYRLSSRVSDMGLAMLDSMPVRQAAHEPLRELRARTGRTASLGVLWGTEVAYVDRWHGSLQGQHAVDGVPRTQKEARCRTNRRMRCCMRDGGTGRMLVRWPSVAALQEEAANHPELLRSRAVVVSVVGKGTTRACQVWITKANASKPLMTCRKCMGDIKTRVASMPWEEPGGSLPTGQVVSGMKVARAWSGLSCGTWEPVAPRPLAASGACIGLRSFVEARTPSSRNCEGESSDAGHRGGPTRSSDEGPVMGLERRGRVVLACLAVNHSWVGGAG